MNDEKRTTGKLRRVGSMEVVHLDCSQWPRDHSKPRSTGKFVRIGQKLAPATAPVESSRLELVVNLAEDVGPIQVWCDVNLLLRAMNAAAPELKLTYDALRSRAEDGDLIIALTSADFAGDEQRLNMLLNALRSAGGKSVQVRAIRVAA
jgi:hypothetical protein